SRCSTKRPSLRLSRVASFRFRAATPFGCARAAPQGFFHRRAVFSCRICFLVHLTIRPPESDGQSESYYQLECEPEKYRKPRDSISYGSGIRAAQRGIGACEDFPVGENNRLPTAFRPSQIRRLGWVIRVDLACHNPSAGVRMRNRLTAAILL